jgi:large subunit ribosomal protein L25
MTLKHTLKAQKRELTGRKVKELRASGLIPANVYGKGIASVSLQINVQEFKKSYGHASESTLFYLEIDGEKGERPVLVRQVTLHPVSGQIMHIDLNQVNLKEKVKAAVAVKLIGEAPAEKDGLGVLVQQLDDVEVEGLPTDIPEFVEISVSGLTKLDQAILVSDLLLKNKVEVLTDKDQIVAKITPMAKEEVVEIPAVEVATEEAKAAESAETPETTPTPAK